MSHTQTFQPPETADRQKALKLTPACSDEIASFFASRKAHELVQALGSPLNVLFPTRLSENLQRFQAVYAQHHINGRIYFAHKSNRSDCIPRHLANTQAFIDVSSINELRHALGSGFAPPRIQATGPKNIEFLSVCIQQNILVAVDSIEELRLLMRLREDVRFGRPDDGGDRQGGYRNGGAINSGASNRGADISVQKVLLRVSGFRNRQLKHQGKASRFGIPYDDIDHAFELLDSCRDRLHLIGFAFHLDTVSALEKAIAAESCFHLFEAALERDFEPTVLNIGGGFKVNYLEHADEWHDYNSAMREAALGARPALTWQGNTFGLIPDRGGLRGSFNSYSFYDATTGADFLKEILNHQIDSRDGDTIAQFLRENGIELWIEPGRALLDQVGITIAHVNSIRQSSLGDTLVCLNMKRQDICFTDQEIFVDPVMLYREESVGSEVEQQPVYFAGNLCLESDLVTRHQTFVPRIPMAGDLVAFINTAGYFMDFSASESIMQPIARKVAAFRRGSCFGWTLDENYYPWIATTEGSI